VAVPGLCLGGKKLIENHGITVAMIHPGPGALISLILFLLMTGMIFLALLRQPFIIQIALRFLRGHTKMNAVFICASCISTVVITGSLIAGDSLKGSITHAAYDNLGEVDEIVTSDRLFNGSLVDRLAENESLMAKVDHIAPLIHLQGFAENPTTGTRTRNARFIGFDQSYLDLGELVSVNGREIGYDLEQNQVYVNEELAQEIDVRIGDKVNISFSHPEQSFEAIFLGDQKKTNLNIQFEVRNVVKDGSLGRFQLTASRNAPQNLYIPIETLQRFMSTDNAINMILVSNNGDEREGVRSSEKVTRILKDVLDDNLDFRDAGLRIRENPEKGYIKLESENVFFPYRYYELLEDDPGSYGADAVSPMLTYFWNSLSFGNRSVPYSTITAFDASRDMEFGLFTDNGSLEELEGSLEENEIMLNNWTAERLQVRIGDSVTMNYSIIDNLYTVHYLKEKFTVKYIVDLKGKASDPMLMPSFPGIEGKTSAFEWDPMFPIDLAMISDADEDYWHENGGTPKAFINLETGIGLWKTDIGNITQIRFSPQDGMNLSETKGQLENILNGNITMEDAFLSILTVKRDALDAAEGIELFTEMFPAFSCACIIASAILIVLLITLGIDSRTTEIGLLRTFGFRKGTIRNIFLLEGSILTIVGGLIGMFLGLLFGAFIITGMNTFWSPIVEDSAVRFYYTSNALIIGFCAGCIISILTMGIGLHYEGKRSVILALRRIPQPVVGSRRSHPGWKGIRMSEIAGCVILITASMFLYSFIESGSVLLLFFVSGFMMVIGLLLLFHALLMRIKGSLLPDWCMSARSIHAENLWPFGFALRNVARDTKRSVITVILFSITLFVLVSLTINLQGIMYDRDRAVEDGGGGYQIMGESTNPIFADLSDECSREENGIHSRVFDELEVEQFRTKGDVGGTCSNLNRQASPRIIGANETFFHDSLFEFTDHTRLGEQDDDPWDLLKHTGAGGEIPAIGDYNTIVWILDLELDSTIQVQDEYGRTVNFRIVGIIENSIFQGSLIIWDGYFDSLYPTDPGFSLFLFRSHESDLGPQIRGLEHELDEYGFDAYTVESVVVKNIEVENTYISVFQVILIFGVIIGTLGAGVVVSRNMMERRLEMGILRSIGFSKKMLIKTMVVENSFIILSGILIGTISGVITSAIILAKLHIGFSSWPWFHVTAILLLTYGIAIACVMIPISKLSKMSISDTLRIYE